MVEMWKKTLDLRVAAAIAILDIPVRVTGTVDTRTGRRRGTYHMGLKSVDGEYVTAKVLADWKSGRLESATPDHPFLTGMRAQESRSAVLAFLKDPAATFLPVRVGKTSVWQLVTTRGAGLPGLSGDVFKTRDLKLFTALCAAGFSPLRVDPDGREHIFYTAMVAAPRPGGAPVPTAHQLAIAWRHDRRAIPWEEPFLQSALTLFARQRISDLESGHELLLVRKPKSQRSALLQPGATDHAWDKVKQHFDR